ncbi:MAG: hypothetical protein D8M59_11460 [Planctomycetes bacterium]|nr:hypothetical protein [Planctomycetota bacterium]
MVSSIGLAQQQEEQQQEQSVQEVKRPMRAQSGAARNVQPQGAARLSPGSGLRVGRRSDQRFDRDELDRLIEAVQLDDGQIVLVESLFQGYRDATSDGVKSVAGFRSGAVFSQEDQPDQDQMMKRMQEAQEAERKWRHDRRVLEVAFFDDIESLLSGPQAQRLWPEYERGYRRRTQLTQRSQLPGEGVDLIVMVDDLDVSESQLAAVDPILSQYAMELDRGILARNEALDSMTDVMDTMVIGEATPNDDDPDRMMKMNQKAREKRVALVDTNRRYCSMLVSNLGPSVGKQLQKQFYQKSFPRIYAPTAADRFLERALGDESLTGSQIGRLTALQADYERRVGIVNDDWLSLELKKDKEMRKPAEERAKERQDDGEPQIQMMMMTTSGDGEVMVHEQPPSELIDEIYEVRKKKHALVQETIDRVYDILNDAQRLSLPKPKVREPRRGGVMMFTGMDAMMGNAELPEGVELDLDDVFIQIEDVLGDVDLEQLMEEGGGAITIQSVQSGPVEGADGEVQQVQEVQIQIGGGDGEGEEESSEDDGEGGGDGGG